MTSLITPDNEATPLVLQWSWKNWKELSQDDLYALLRLRQDVFVVEQDCPYSDADGCDPSCFHLLGRYNEMLAAYLRVFPPGQYREEIVIGRVVTAIQLRGKGLGSALMIEGERSATEAFGSHPFFLSAQAHLKPWYNSLGYKVCGIGYDEDGIPHLPMRKEIHGE